MKSPVIYRQGDVLITEVAPPAGKLAPIPREEGRIILASGEVTGHHHAIAAESARFALNEQTMQRFLTVEKQVALNHEEHAEIKLPAGTYEITIQREYDGEYIRPVVD